MKKIIRWLVNYAYYKEIKTMAGLLNDKQAQIENLKEQIRYLRNENLFNERKTNEHLRY